MPRRCKCGCREEIKPARQCTSYMEKLGFATVECQGKAAIVALDKIRAQKKKKKAKEDKEYRKITRERKQALKTRNDWFADYQIDRNWWVLNVRDRGKPCCTCKKNNDVKYDAGHFLTRGSRSELRFELTNIHKQCSWDCNHHGSGMVREYNQFIIDTYGQEHLDWLIGPHPSLKEQFPHIDDIREAIKKQRKINREAKKLQIV